MAQAGTLEVLLVGAKGLENTDYLCKLATFSSFPFPPSNSALISCYLVDPSSFAGRLISQIGIISGLLVFSPLLLLKVVLDSR
jgi:hypothetical protein